jgi:hypothetical protein
VPIHAGFFCDHAEGVKPVPEAVSKKVPELVPPIAEPGRLAVLWRSKTNVIAPLALAAILLHLVLRFLVHTTPGVYQVPLLATLFVGGLPLLFDLCRKVLKGEFGADLLGGISVVTSLLLHEYLAGSIIVLMLAGGEALENYALRSASSVLAALAKRMPSVAHRKRRGGHRRCRVGRCCGRRCPRDPSRMRPVPWTASCWRDAARWMNRT